MKNQNNSLSQQVKNALIRKPKWIAFDNKDVNVAIKQTLKEIA